MFRFLQRVPKTLYSKNLSYSLFPLLKSSHIYPLYNTKRYYINNIKQQSDNDIIKSYSKLSQIEHVLLRPDSYIGSTQNQSNLIWIYDNKTKKYSLETLNYIPGLLKIFDEILVNAADNKQRSKHMNEIKVLIDSKTNEIEIYNNGTGIPIVYHDIHKCYIPELVLGTLLSGSNFDDTIGKLTGGRNGYGAKLANIFSTEFHIETLNKKRKLLYKQSWSNNMNKKNDPIIEKLTNNTLQDDYTKITFKPDLKRFGISSLASTNNLKIMKARVRELAACFDNNMNIYLNNKLIPCGFNEYIDHFPRYYCEEGNNGICNLKINNRWNIAITTSSLDKFEQVSFVNCINTFRGGTHINHILDQIIQGLSTHLSNKIDKSLGNMSNAIKQHLMLFVNCNIENPSFSSQTKETLTTKKTEFADTCKITSKHIKKIIDETDIIYKIKNWYKQKKTNDLNKIKTKITAKKQLHIPKLDDANWAGGRKSHECTLILTEGDSAKALAVAGLSVLGRDKYGVFPLKGKLLNVRAATHSMITKSKEISDLVKILGLNFKLSYENNSPKDWNTRYGKIMLMADQDHDGSHVKGLIINFIHFYWPNLLKHGFFQQFITPIIKVSKGKEILSFFSIPDYNKWKSQLSSDIINKWKIKYYKGLGTSSPQEAKEYFKNYSKHVKDIKWDNTTNNTLDLAFSKIRSDDRKNWMLNYNSNNDNIDNSQEFIEYSDFINKELIQFSLADLIRSIPSVIDGFKPSQRKVLYSCFKKKLNNEIKVAQLAGYISEKTAYHHGEVSLHNSIISMAQNYIGSNNIPFLQALGQFGTRLEGGSDHASARYIFTQLNPISRLIFRELDDSLLQYTHDDGYPAEPYFFVPILPVILINGCNGIGTGWSSYIPPYNPIDIIDNLLLYLQGQAMNIELIPYFHKLKGSIISDSKGNYISRGEYIKKDNSIHITELPARTWTNYYKEFLDKVQVSDKNPWKIKKYKAYHTETDVSFTLDLNNDSPLLEQNTDELYNTLRLEKSILTSNMHLFNSDGKITKYNTPIDIINDFIPIRKQYYELRKSNQLNNMKDSLDILRNKKQFCNDVITNKISIFGKSKDSIIKQLLSYKYKQLQVSSTGQLSYDYLIRLPLDSFSSENIKSLQSNVNDKENEYKQLKNTSLEDIWINELKELKDYLILKEYFPNNNKI